MAVGTTDHDAMRDGARPRMELEDHRGKRSPLVWVAIGCVIMFVVAVVMFVILARRTPGEVGPPVEPPAEQRP
jgi:hypothetical protein